MHKNIRYKKDFSKYENLEGWECLTLGEQLEAWAQQYKGKVAVVEGEQEITYEQLDHKATALAYAFMDEGIQPGDKVLVQLPNRISFVLTLFALTRAGAIPILALPAHREAELEGIIKVAQPSANIVAEKYLGYDYLPMAKRLKEKYPCVKRLLVDGTREGEVLLQALRGKERILPKIDCYAPAVLLLSGGTTGVPKLIPRSHSDYMYNARASSKKCRLDGDSVYLAALPVAHNFPLCCPGVLGTLDQGGTVILSPTTSPDDILRLITEEKVTITALVPSMITVCMEMLEWEEDYNLTGLKLLQVGGAVLDDSLADKIIAEWPCKLMQVFGTAEGLLCFTDWEDEDSIVVRCQGKPISPADEVQIVDEAGKKVPDGTYGELQARGPYTIDGYYRSEAANQTSFTEEGYYRTGDKALWTPEGNIRMGGRMKEQINRAGEKIMPSEIEGYLCKHPSVKEAAVIGVPDEVLGNRICAFIMTKQGEALELLEIHQYLRGIGVAAYKLPDQLEHVEVWPLTSVGKIDKTELGEMAKVKRGESEWNIQK